MGKLREVETEEERGQMERETYQSQNLGEMRGEEIKG